MKIRSHVKFIPIAALLLLGLHTPDSWAQFKKFKSKSRFNQTEPAEQSPPEARIGDDLKAFTNDDTSNNQNTFGNRVNPLQGKPQDSKYVNLNPETAFGPEIITSFDFPDTDILELTKHMQSLTGINLILDKDVKGKVSITAPTPITVGDAWKAYLTALEMAGFSIVKSGAFYKIISARDIRYAPSRMYTGSYTPETDAHIMKVIALKNVDAQEISRNFRPFLSRNGRMMEIKQTNTIIVSDTGTHINRLEKLIKFVDVPGHEESLQIIPVKNTSAQEIAKLLDEILSSKSGGVSSGPGGSAAARRRSARFSSLSSGGSSSQNISKIIAEPRTNSIIAMANAEGARQLTNLIKKLDVKIASSGSGRVHVHYLNFGNAEELAKTLTNLISGAVADNKGNTAKKFIPAEENSSAIFNAEVKVTADKDNNALVVTASPTDWLTLKDVISKLDIPRDQVYVEGMIMETTITKVREYGTDWVAATGQGNAQRVGFTPSGKIYNLLQGDPTNIGTMFAGFGGPGQARDFNIGGNKVKINSVNGFIKALASHSSTNILATPQILAMDNVDAEFEVGRTQPTLQTTTATNGTTTNSTTNQEAKLSLKITPQINKVTRFVKLKITQNINDFDASATPNAAGGLPTTTRSAVTEVMVRDRDTIAMGGLLRDKITKQKTKVPLLGDIPILGWLFKAESTNVEKINLLFFMTPKILSPYKELASRNTLDAIKQREEHLKQILKEDDAKDAHIDVVGKLKAKIGKQVSGPLYDVNSKLENDVGEYIAPASDATTEEIDYQAIRDEAEQEIE